MGLFENYENIPSSYIPNNICPPRQAPSIPKTPLAQYNAKGDFVGYTWSYGDEVNLKFLISGNVTYDNNDILPEVYKVDGAGGIYQEAEDYLEGKFFEFTLFNFRGEAIWRGYQKASASTIFYIDRKCSKGLVPGIYRGKLILMENPDTVDDSSDCQVTTTLVCANDYIFTIK